MMRFRSALIALLLFTQAPAWAVEFGIAHPRVLGSQRQSYFERPDILQVEAREHPELQWQAWREAHLEAAAAFLELYPTEHLYFLARDAELLYDAVRLISRDDPQTLSRLHLLNVSRANMRDEHLLEYLAQEGITPERLREESSFQPIFIDTGFSGTIPGVIADRMPEDVRDRLRTHLLASSNAAMPSLRSFLLPVNPAINGLSPSSMHGTIVGYEHIARATERSDAYQQANNEWHPTSSTDAASNDGQINAATALHYQEDLKAYLQSSEATTTLQARRELWRELRTNWLTLSKKAWTELLKAKLENAGDTLPQTESVIRDFLEWAKLIGKSAAPQAPFITFLDVELSSETEQNLSNKLQLAALYPQWAPILEDPDTQIPALLDSGQIGTLGAILDVVEDSEIRAIALDETSKRLEVSSVYALIQSLLENIAVRNWVLHLFARPQMHNHPELLRLAIEKATPEQMQSFATHVFSQSHWSKHPELLRLAIEKTPREYLHYFIRLVFHLKHWSNAPELLRLTIDRALPEQVDNFACYVFDQEHWRDHPELLRLAIERVHPHARMNTFIEYTLSHAYWRNHPQTEVFMDAAYIADPERRRAYLREQLGPYPWEADAPAFASSR